MFHVVLLVILVSARLWDQQPSLPAVYSAPPPAKTFRAVIALNEPSTPEAVTAYCQPLFRDCALSLTHLNCHRWKTPILIF